ncbi:Uncharacterized protein Adt_32765 [Abeliophyllum distichum]|uniref:Uncharacterized protein n=1 Tax=Abeliophyllum distichum TaxID=126358 RepID=A0ABD1QXY7_9LAMI
MSIDCPSGTSIEVGAFKAGIRYLVNFSVVRKINFSFIVLNHVNNAHSIRKITGLPYETLLTKIFQHLEVPISDEFSISQKPTDTINLSTLKKMKIVKEQGQWVAKTKEFDTESGISTLPFEGNEVMEDIGQDEEYAHLPSPPHDIPRLSMPGFTFSEDHYNLLNG